MESVPLAVSSTTLQRHLHASTRPKMHSFVHGLYSPNPTAPHHESTPLNPSHQRSISMRHHHWPSHLFDTVGSQRGSTEVLYAMEEGVGGSDWPVRCVSPENESKAVVRPLTLPLTHQRCCIDTPPCLPCTTSSPRHRKTLGHLKPKVLLHLCYAVCGVPACSCPGVACSLVLRTSRGLRRHSRWPRSGREWIPRSHGVGEPCIGECGRETER